MNDTPYDLNKCVILSVVSADLKCSICSRVFSNPKQCRSGHMYCCNCIPNIKFESVDCSSCSELVSVSAYNQVPLIVTKMIGRLQIECPLKCEWTGAFESVADHAKQCRNSIAECLFCHVKIRQSLLDSHVFTCSKNPDRHVHCVCGADLCSLKLIDHVRNDLAEHLLSIYSKMKTLSTISFTWVHDNATRSPLYSLGGIDWFLLCKQGSVSLCTKIAPGTIQRRIEFTITCDDIIIAQKTASYRNNGTCVSGAEFNGDTFVCTIQLIE